MYIKCKGYCFICDCPLEPYVKTDNKEKRELIRKYKKIKPIFLINNGTYLKFFKLKVERVCYSCFKTCSTPSQEVLRSREIGKIKTINRNLSLSRKEVFLWYIGLYKYVNKHFHNRPIVVYNDI